MTTSVAEKAGNASLVGDNRAHSNGRSGENKCGGCEKVEAGNGGAKEEPLCNGSKQMEGLLCLWRIWAYGPIL